jgi:hypothetical protein
VGGGKEGVREIKQRYSLAKEHVIAPLDHGILRAVYGRCSHVQSRLGTGVIRFGRRGEGMHRESGMLGRSTAVSSVERPPSVGDEG